MRNITASLASHNRAAFSATVSSTGWRSVGELAITRRISLVAVCCSRTSLSSRRSSSTVPGTLPRDFFIMGRCFGEGGSRFFPFDLADFIFEEPAIGSHLAILRTQNYKARLVNLVRANEGETWMRLGRTSLRYGESVCPFFISSGSFRSEERR